MNQAKEHIVAFNIAFDEQEAFGYTVSSSATSEEISAALKVPPYETILLLFGGADTLDETKKTQIKTLFQDGLIPAIKEKKSIIIDGGTRAGIMQLMGASIAEDNYRLPLIGVVPEKLVSYPGKADENLTPLDEHHSHFLLVTGGAQWGDETKTMFKLARALTKGQKNKPSVAVLIGGGSITAKEALSSVREGITLIIIKNSGGFADTLAAASDKKNTPSPDKAIQEILQDGDLLFYDLDGQPKILSEQIERILTTDAILYSAWEQFAKFDLNAKRQQDKHKRFQKNLIRLGIAVALTATLYHVLFTATKQAEFTDWQWFFYALSVTLPVVLTVVTVASHNFKNGKKWIFFRAAAENLKREIFAYRTRTGAYRKTPGPLFAQRLSGIVTKAMGTEINSAYIEPYDAAKGYPPKMYGEEAQDDGFSKLSPEDYIRIRLKGQISYYETKTGELRKKLDWLQWTTYILAGAGALLAVFGQQVWIAVATTVGTTIGAWIGQMQWENSVSTYNQNAANLNEIMLWWDGLTPAAQSLIENRDELVLRTETTLKNEYDGWVQQMKQSLDKLDTKNDASDKKKP